MSAALVRKDISVATPLGFPPIIRFEILREPEDIYPLSASCTFRYADGATELLATEGVVESPLGSDAFLVLQQEFDLLFVSPDSSRFSAGLFTSYTLSLSTATGNLTLSGNLYPSQLS